MIKKLWGVILTVSLVVSLSGCGSSSSTPVSAQTKSVSSSQANSQSSAAPQVTPATTPPKESTTVIPGQKLKVSYIDVGQGDSILVQIPNGKNLLIDAGTNESTNTVLSYIKKQGISKLDVVIGTHPHEDHIGGLDAVINTFDIGQVIMPRKESTTQTYRDVIKSIQNKGLKITEAKAGVTLDLGPEVNAKLVAPTGSSYEDVNDYSAVLKLTYGTKSFLFEGDAQALSESQMITSGVNLKADVLKVGHHGSHTSSSPAFLAKLSPKYAIISVGKGNSYGHPTQTTLDHLASIGSTVYRTDQSGTIVAESDGTNITINAIATEVQPRAPSSSSNVITQPAPSTSAPIIAPTPPPSQSKDVTVYVTKTGKKYHRDGCRYLSKSKIPISLSGAKNAGYGPCSVCNPPQ